MAWLESGLAAMPVHCILAMNPSLAWPIKLTLFSERWGTLPSFLVLLEARLKA